MEESEEILKEHEEMNLSQLMGSVKEKMIDGEEDIQTFEKLQKIMENVDFSILDTEFDDNFSGISKRRKVSRGHSEITDGQLLEKIKKQIDLVKSALSVIYDIENRNFKRFLAKDSAKKSRHVDSSVVFFRRLEDYAQALPLWVDTDGEAPPPLCGAIKAEENYVANVGDLVAAYVPYKKKDYKYIIAEVLAYDPIKREYTVDDIYELKLTEQIVPWDNIVPLPKRRADPENNPDALFQNGDNVLALYPGSTCFYHAIVKKMPVSADDQYTLVFDGDDENCVQVHQLFVIHDVPQDDVQVKCGN